MSDQPTWGTRKKGSTKGSRRGRGQEGRARGARTGTPLQKSNLSGPLPGESETSRWNKERENPLWCKRIPGPARQSPESSFPPNSKCHPCHPTTYGVNGNKLTTSFPRPIIRQNHALLFAGGWMKTNSQWEKTAEELMKGGLN